MAKISAERKAQRDKNILTASKLFRQWGGEECDGFPAIHKFLT